MKRMGILNAIVFVAFASSAHAQAPQQLYACVNNNSGEIKLVGHNATCNGNSTLVVWNVAGPQGMIGPQGPQGPAGAPGLIGLSEYTCGDNFFGQIVPIFTPVSFTFRGNTIGAGVGGNSTSPVASFVLQPGLYQITFKAEAVYTPTTIGQVRVSLSLDGIFQTFFYFSNVETQSAPSLPLASGSKLVNVSQPNQTLSFVTQSLNEVLTAIQPLDCYMSIAKLQ
jgi:hypothetical protein